VSEPRTDRDIDQALEAWMDGAAPGRAPTRLLEGTFARTMTARQVHAYAWNRVAIGSAGRAAPGIGLRVGLILLVALALAAVAFGIVGGGQRQAVLPIATPTQPASPTTTPSPTSLPALPAPLPVTPQAVIPVRGSLDMVSSGPSLWVLAPGRFDRIDPAKNAVTASVPFGVASDLYNGMAANAAGLWATDSDNGTLYRVNPGTLKVSATIPAGQAPKGILATADGVWVADVHGGTVLRIDPATNKVVATVTVGPTGPSGPNWLASGLGSIWVDVPNNPTVVRIDPVTNRVQATIHVPVAVVPCGGIAIGTAAVWITSCSAGTTIARIDPTTNTVVATVDLGGNGQNPTLINDAPWISVDTGDASSGKLIRIDPATNTIDRVLVPGTSFGGGGDIVVAAGSVWVADGYNNSVIRLPMTAFAP
jgi:virginiamycin B lyase